MLKVVRTLSHFTVQTSFEAHSDNWDISSDEKKHAVFSWGNTSYLSSNSAKSVMEQKTLEI